MRYICGYKELIGAVISAAIIATPVSAQTAVDPNVKAEDIPLQPLKDMNLDKDEIPPLLIDIANDPYSAEGLESCADIERAIADIDTLLGADVDMPGKDRSDLQKGANSAGRIAAGIIGGLIPFRGVVRELSGAKGEERRLRRIVTAGMIRRGFLKGIGLERECPWPARPAAGTVEFDEEKHEQAKEREDQSAAASDGAVYTTNPMVQPTP